MKEEEKVYGYKAFYEGLINNNGEKFSIGKTNYANVESYFCKKGYLFCEDLVDSLSFVNTFENKIEIAEVCSDDLNGYILSKPYNGHKRHVCYNLEVVRIIPRKEIIDSMLKVGEMDKFVSLYKLTDDEIEYILENYNGSIDYLSRYIERYQKGEKDAFVRTRKY